MAKYQYAYGNRGQVVFIEDLSQDSLLVNKFTCIACGREVIARLGQVKQKHFAHKEEVLCSGETDLHQLGKQFFYEAYKKCLATQSPLQVANLIGWSI